MENFRRNWVIVMMLIAINSLYALGDEMRYNVTFNSESLRIDTVFSNTGIPFLSIFSSESDFCGNRGEFMLPYKSVRLIVPYNSTDYTVDMTDVKFKDVMKLGLPLCHVQEDFSMNSDIRNLSYEEKGEYKNDVFFSQAKILSSFTLNGLYKIVSVAVPAVMYDNIADKIDILDSAEIRLIYSCSEIKEEEKVCIRPSSILDYNVSEFADNFQDYYLQKSLCQFSEEVSEKPINYYIITPATLQPYLADLIGWKRQKGYTVIVKTVESILADRNFSIGSGEDKFDKESSIRSWLKSELDEKGCFQLLIIGDDKTSAPIRKFRVNDNVAVMENYNNYDGENFIPSDVYFSDLSSGFVLSREDNGYYTGLVDIQPYSPEIPVGRLLANTPGHLENFWKKVLIYELDPGLGDSSYLDRAVLSQQYQFSNNSSLFGKLYWYFELITMKDETGVRDYEKSSPTGREVIEEMKKSGLYSLAGHGSPRSIATSGRSSVWDDYLHYRYIQAMDSYPYTSDDSKLPGMEVGNGLDNLNNFGRPSILYSMSCDITPFDVIDFYGSGKMSEAYNMGSSFTVAGNFGGPVLIGNTRTGWSGSHSALERSFGIEVKDGASVGVALNKSGLKTDLETSSVGMFAKFTRNIIGDPDVKIWLGRPNVWNPDVSFHGSSMTVSGSGLSGSAICISDGDAVSKTYQCENEVETIELNSLGIDTLNPFIVSVFKKDCLPFVKLYSPQAQIRSRNMKFYVNCDRVGGETDSGYKFDLGKKSLFELIATRGIKTDKAFHIQSEGELRVTAFKDIVLKNDKVSDGGKLSVVANEVTLDAGFEIEKGGELIINCINR